MVSHPRAMQKAKIREETEVRIVDCVPVHSCIRGWIINLISNNHAISALSFRVINSLPCLSPRAKETP